jgi:hypothetical protein
VVSLERFGLLLMPLVEVWIGEGLKLSFMVLLDVLLLFVVLKSFAMEEGSSFPSNTLCALLGTFCGLLLLRDSSLVPVLCLLKYVWGGQIQRIMRYEGCKKKKRKIGKEACGFYGMKLKRVYYTNIGLFSNKILKT